MWINIFILNAQSIRECMLVLFVCCGRVGYDSLRYFYDCVLQCSIAMSISLFICPGMELNKPLYNRCYSLRLCFSSCSSPYGGQYTRQSHRAVGAQYTVTVSAATGPPPSHQDLVQGQASPKFCTVSHHSMSFINIMFYYLLFVFFHFTIRSSCRYQFQFQYYTCFDLFLALLGVVLLQRKGPSVRLYNYNLAA